MEYLNVRTMERSKGMQPSDPMPQTQPSVQNQGYTVGQDSEFSVPENVILQTTNYGMFKLDPHNRVIRQDKLDRLYTAIQARNLLHLFPIVVTRNLVIIDGQHRFKVAEALETPIYYIISSQMQIEDAAHVNSNTDNWKMADYLHHWCAMGLPDYLLLRDFQAANDFLSISTAAKLCFYGNTGGSSNSTVPTFTTVFEKGRFIANDVGFAARIAGMARDFSVWVRFWKEATFIRALANLASCADYDHRHMMQKMEYLSTRLVKCPDIPTYMILIESIYNYRSIESRKVTFRKLNSRRRYNRSNDENSK